MFTERSWTGLDGDLDCIHAACRALANGLARGLRRPNEREADSERIEVRRLIERGRRRAWAWRSTRPGITYLPAASMIVAPGGTSASPSRTTAAIRPPWIAIVIPGCGGAPVPSMTVAPVITRSARCASAQCGKDSVQTPAKGSTTARPAMRVILLPECGFADNTADGRLHPVVPRNLFLAQPGEASGEWRCGVHDSSTDQREQASRSR